MFLYLTPFVKVTFLLEKQIPQYQHTKGTNSSTGYAFLSLNNYLAVIASTTSIPRITF